MGVVWLAWDPRLEREVALKQLPPELARDDTVRQRFVTEARSAAKLQHPGILPLFDVGESDGLPFFVMQKVDGGDLADHLAVSGRMSVDAAAPLLRQMAAAIDHAHQAGVVHRDIKPENILLDRSGQALLTDFGIARAAESGNRGLTRTGMILGTPEYMSPEQAAGGAVDHRADLYSFGVIAYRMLTGTVPFGGDSVLGVAMQHVSAPPPDPRLLAPELSEGVARALQVMLAKEPGQRYQSASEFVERLTAGDEQRAAPAPRAATVFAPLPGVEATQSAPAGGGRGLGLRPAVVAAALVLGLSLLGATTLQRRPEPPPPPPPPRQPEPPPPPPPAPPPERRLSPRVSVSSALRPGTSGTYGGSNLVDGSVTEVWAADNNRRGTNGTGETITLRFDVPVMLTRLRVFPGHGKTSYYSKLSGRTVNLFEVNNRPGAMEVAYEGGLRTMRFEDNPEWHELSLDGAGPTRSLTLTVKEVTKGWRDNDLCVAELEVYGWAQP